MKAMRNLKRKICKMSKLSYMEKLLDGVEVEWKALEDLSIDKF
jgi:hypothetical protein